MRYVKGFLSTLLLVCLTTEIEKQLYNIEKNPTTCCSKKPTFIVAPCEKALTILKSLIEEFILLVHGYPLYYHK